MKKLLLLVPILVLAGCGGRHCYDSSDISMLYDEARLSPPDKPITLWIHGGARPVSSLLAIPGFYTACPRGFTPYKDLGRGCSTGKRIGVELDRTDDEQFPLDGFFVYGWPGILSFGLRRREGRCLYKILRCIRDNPRYKDTPITIITHSYGGQVALNIAQGAMENNDERPLVDRLIITAMPIVVGCQELVESPVFKQVFHFFSKSDFAQVLDPQFIYPIASRKSTCAPFFSRRRLQPCDHLIQAEIKLNNKSSTGHMGFVECPFLRSLPDILDILNDETRRSLLTKDKYGCYCVNINTRTGVVGPCRPKKECFLKKKIKSEACCECVDE